IDPASLIGTTIVRVRRSPTHPTTSLVLSDGRTFQVRVHGYSPAHAALPRTLETSGALFSATPASPSGRAVRLTVRDARLVALKDTALARSVGSAEERRWSVEHLALAVRFEEEDGWQCVWAAVEEYGERGACVYRTYDDVYVQEVRRGKRAGVRA
ncbi:hypothetical protein K488DRAFT_49831, partial [Vararia minispora EC-137]